MSRVIIPHTANPKASDPNTGYSAKRGRSFLFQVTAPQGTEPLFPVFLALNVNPTSVEEHMQKSKTVAMTYGGWVEWVWPDELGSVSCSASTGAFLHPYQGLTVGGDGLTDDVTSSGRKGTIAWERQQDLLELFHNNGMVYNMVGEPVIRGRVMMMYDRGVFLGHFSTFQPVEDDQHPFSFQLSWEFKVEQTLYSLPSSPADHMAIEDPMAGSGAVGVSSSDFTPSQDTQNPFVDDVAGAGAPTGSSTDFAASEVTQDPFANDASYWGDKVLDAANAASTQGTKPVLPPSPGSNFVAPTPSNRGFPGKGSK